MSPTSSHHGLALIAYSPKYIVEFVKDHPIDWCNKKLAERGGIGDSAGVTPTPAVAEFLSLLRSDDKLFCQEKYWEHCKAVWEPWLSTKTPAQVSGVRAKVFRNFYPAMIDSLHVWSMLHKHGTFDICVLDSHKDAVGKTDLTVMSGIQTWKIALLAGSAAARRDGAYKMMHRGDSPTKCMEVVLPMGRPKTYGNKRWYYFSDFTSMFEGIQWKL